MSDYESGDTYPFPRPTEPESTPAEVVRRYDERTWFSSSVSDATLRMKAVGEVDLYSTPVMKLLFLEQLADHPEITEADIDLTEAQYLDSAGLGILVGLAKRIHRQSGHGGFTKYVTVKASTPDIPKILEITGLDRVFNVVQVDPEQPDPLA